MGVSKAYFDDQFPIDMAEKTADIPEENLQSPRPSVAIPAMEGLRYSLDEPDLKEMYLNLLTTATDNRRAAEAHPAFAEVIKQLTHEEAKLLNILLAQGIVPAVRLKDVVNAEQHFSLKFNHLLALNNGATGEAQEFDQISIWVDNWVRLGLIDVTYTEFLTAPGSYDWVTMRPEFMRLSSDSGITQLDFDKGILRGTDFGRRFALAVTPSKIDGQ